MHVGVLILAWLDNRTLLATQLVVLLVYAFTFAAMRRMHPTLRGTGQIALGFASGFLGTFLIAARGTIPLWLSVIVANFLVFAAMAHFYTAILRFFRSPRKPLAAWLVTVAATVAMTFYCIGHDSIVPRILIASITMSLLRGIIAVELYRQAAGRTFFKVFAALMSIEAVIGLNRFFLTPILGALSSFLQPDIVQTTALALHLIFSSILGVLLLLTLCGELLALSQAQTEIDSLSGTFNRRGIETRLAAELKRIDRSGQRLSIALLDIDHFKSINDTIGHAAGDDALRGVADTVTARLRAYDSFGRYGGDEFLLVLPQTSSADATIVTERIHHAIDAFSLFSDGLPITLSIGLTQAVQGELATDLLARADRALYEAKRSGRNCTRLLLHEPDPRPEALAEPKTAILSTPHPRPATTCRSGAHRTAATRDLITK